MIVAPLVGGLSNQLVIYAAAKSLSINNSDELYFDLSYFDRRTACNYRLDELSINEKSISNSKLWSVFSLYKYPNSRHVKWLMSHLFKGKNIYKEPSLSFDGDFFSLKGNVYLNGGFISLKYYESILPLLQKECIPKNISTAAQKYCTILNENNSVSLHIRRGDYVTNKNASEFHGVLGLEYYRSAVEFVKNSIDKPAFYIFSDDINYVKKHFKFLEELDVTFISGQDGLSDLDEFEIMKYSRVNVIANSGFSRWSALFNYRASTVIMPKQWFKGYNIDTKDVGLESWIRIDSNFL